jgi:hypothetical protein
MDFVKKYEKDSSEGKHDNESLMMNVAELKPYPEKDILVQHD